MDWDADARLHLQHADPSLRAGSHRLVMVVGVLECTWITWGLASVDTHFPVFGSVQVVWLIRSQSVNYSKLYPFDSFGKQLANR